MLEITEIAVEKIKEVLEEEGKEDKPLRIIALPNEQGGVQYMLTLEDDNQPDDTSLDRSGIRFLVDSDSAPFLEKATIDFVEDFTRVGFLITNPDYPAGLVVAAVAPAAVVVVVVAVDAAVVAVDAAVIRLGTRTM